MSSFTSPLDVRVLQGEEAGRGTASLLAPFTYWTEIVGYRWDIIVPVGFETDFASIPRLFWTIVPPHGRHSKAAVVHDYLCRYKLCDSKTAHRIFLEAMEVLDVPKWRRYLMYWAVALFGPRFEGP